MLTRGRVKSSIQMLIHASKKGDIGLVRSMIAEGLDVCTADYEGNTSLLLAAFMGHEEVVRALLDAGAVVDATSTEPLTPLLAAATAGHEGVVRLLVSRGANIAARDAFNWTPLMRAAEAGHAGVVGALREAGAREPAEPPPPPTDGSPIDTTMPGYFPFNGQGGMYGFYSQGIAPPAQAAWPPGSAIANEKARQRAVSDSETRRARDFAELESTAAERRRRDEADALAAALHESASVPFCAPPDAMLPLQMNPFDMVPRLLASEAVRIFERIGIRPLEDPIRRGKYEDMDDGFGRCDGAPMASTGLPYGLHSQHPLLARMPLPLAAPPPLISPPGEPPPPYIPYAMYGGRKGSDYVAEQEGGRHFFFSGDAGNGFQRFGGGARGSAGGGWDEGEPGEEGADERSFEEAHLHEQVVSGHK